MTATKVIPAKMTWPRFLKNEFFAYPSLSSAEDSDTAVFNESVQDAKRSSRYFTHSFGIIFILEMDTIVFRHISRLLGMTNASMGVCVRI